MPILDWITVFEKKAPHWGSRFLDFPFLQLNLDSQKNSKTKVGKVFLFIFMSSYAKISFWGPKKRKSHEIGANIFFFKWVDMVTKNP
jgi:hypothetical protein